MENAEFMLKTENAELTEATLMKELTLARENNMFAPKMLINESEA